ncbi:serine hydrolase [Enterovirga sp. CN4-39]|uniref:serine hydrolase n=1 Tax=Enterovirga sp. CN4-39 TaxID=3400910 RepID=UPI003C08087F
MRSSTSVIIGVLAATMSLGQPTVAGAAPGEPAYRLWRGDPKLQSHGVDIDRMIADFVRKNDLPGIAMAIVQAPYIPRSAGYGVTDRQRDELASTKTMWSVGPLTQAFTAVAIMQLKEAGKLAIDDPAEKHLPNLPPAWRTVTIKELMQHASGIPDFRGAGYDAAKRCAPGQLVDLVRAAPLQFEAGTDVRLSATNFVLLGLIIERASGMSYEDHITRHQIEPLRLESTMFFRDFSKKSFLDRPAKPGFNQHSKFHTEVPFINPVEPAVGYVESGGKLTPIAPDATANLYAYGGLWSSAQDISAWDIALAGAVLVKDEADRDFIYKPTRLANGRIVPAMAGWEFTPHGFMEVKGNGPGFSAYLSRFTAADELVCVTLLTNKEGVDLTELARAIADAYNRGLGAGADPSVLLTQESKFGVAETVQRLKAELAAQNVPVFATFDHAQNASEAGLPLRPTSVVVFGNPKVGTKLMQERQAAAIDLPLRVSVWQDDRNRVWVGRQNMDALGTTYGIEDTATLAAIDKLLARLVAKSANVYAY